MVSPPIARATRISVSITDLGFGKRVVVRCPCFAVGALAVKDAVVEELLDELRARHRRLRPPTCAHREYSEGALVNEM